MDFYDKIALTNDADRHITYLKVVACVENDTALGYPVETVATKLEYYSTYKFECQSQDVQTTMLDKMIKGAGQRCVEVLPETVEEWEYLIIRLRQKAYNSNQKFIANKLIISQEFVKYFCKLPKLLREPMTIVYGGTYKLGVYDGELEIYVDTSLCNAIIATVCYPEYWAGGVAVIRENKYSSMFAVDVIEPKFITLCAFIRGKK